MRARCISERERNGSSQSATESKREEARQRAGWLGRGARPVSAVLGRRVKEAGCGWSWAGVKPAGRNGLEAEKRERVRDFLFSFSKN